MPVRSQQPRTAQGFRPRARPVPTLRARFSESNGASLTPPVRSENPCRNPCEASSADSRWSGTLACLTRGRAVRSPHDGPAVSFRRMGECLQRRDQPERAVPALCGQLGTRRRALLCKAEHTLGCSGAAVSWNLQPAYVAAISPAMSRYRRRTVRDRGQLRPVEAIISAGWIRSWPCSHRATLRGHCTPCQGRRGQQKAGTKCSDSTDSSVKRSRSGEQDGAFMGCHRKRFRAGRGALRWGTGRHLQNRTHAGHLATIRSPLRASTRRHDRRTGQLEQGRVKVWGKTRLMCAHRKKSGRQLEKYLSPSGPWQTCPH